MNKFIIPWFQTPLGVNKKANSLQPDSGGNILFYLQYIEPRKLKLLSHQNMKCYTQGMNMPGSLIEK